MYFQEKSMLFKPGATQITDRAPAEHSIQMATIQSLAWPPGPSPSKHINIILRQE